MRHVGLCRGSIAVRAKARDVSRRQVRDGDAASPSHSRSFSISQAGIITGASAMHAEIKAGAETLSPSYTRDEPVLP